MELEIGRPTKDVVVVVVEDDDVGRLENMSLLIYG